MTPAVLDYCLARTSFRRCADPRDKVFSLLGTAAKASQHCEGVPLAIRADYSESVVDVYTETMTYILSNINVLTPLTRVQHPSALSPDGLPSWVCDFTDIRNVPLLDIQEAAYGIHNYRPFDASRQASVGFSIDGRTFRASCHRCASVTHVSEVWNEMIEQDSFEKMAELALARFDASAIQELRIDELWQTMLCDVTAFDGWEFSKQGMRSSFRNFLFFLSQCLVCKLRLSDSGGDFSSKMRWQELLANVDDTNTIPSPQTAIETPFNFDPSTDVAFTGSYLFQNIAGRTMPDRRLFLLDNSQIGLGGRGVEPGDVMCILADGGKTPVMLRNADADFDNAWRLISDAYVRGIMYGEAVDQMERDGKTWEEISII